MQNMIKIYRPDYCTKCMTPRSVEIYNFFNSPIGFSKVLDDKEKGLNIIFDKVPLYYAKCRNCRERFIIYWRNGIPTPCSIDHPEMSTFLDIYATPQKLPEYNINE